MAKAKQNNSDGDAEEITGMPIDELHKKLAKKIKSGVELKDSDLKSISTGSIRLDWALKLPCLEGSMMEIFAPQAVGKSTLALHISKNAMDMGKLVFYIDLEYKLREAQLTMIRGFNRDKFSVIYPDTAEEALEIMHKLIVDFPGCVIILDSVGGLLQEVENAESFEKQGMGGISKLLHKMVRKLTGIAARNKVLLIFLNHLIATMAMYGQKDTTHGGFAIKNRAAQRIELAALASDAIKEGDVKIGQNVRATVVKNNVNRPFIQVYFPIIYGRGIDQELELMEFARDLGLLKYQAKGGWWSFTKDDGSDSGAMRADDLRNILLTDSAFRKSLVDKIMAMAG